MKIPALRPWSFGTVPALPRFCLLHSIAAVRHTNCCQSAVVAAVNTIALLPCRRHRSQQRFSKGVLSAAARVFGGVPAACDPIRSSPQIDGGKINRLSHWTLPT
jgi:hypothetical protein